MSHVTRFELVKMPFVCLCVWMLNKVAHIVNTAHRHL